MALSHFDILVVGSGLSGTVIAERYASIGKKVLVLEKRDHLGGNCFDYQNQHGIRVSKYGAHLFHTNSQRVWNYLQNFNDWRQYEHRVLAKVNNKLLPLPVNINTINQFFGENLKDSAEAKQFLKKKVKKIKDPQTSYDWGLSKLGVELYSAIFANYSQKQWGLDLKELDASILSRLPLRYSFDNRYFLDEYQALPKNGYTQLFKKLLNSPNIKVQLNTDYFKIKNELPHFEKIFYTGPIDQFFEYRYGALEYRSLNIQFEDHQLKNYQSNSAINFPAKQIPYTRIIEYKYFYPVDSAWTTISKEYPVWGGEPYYPVPRPRNNQLYKKYQAEAKKLERQGVYCLGRLGTYHYINMDQAVGAALNLFDKTKN